MTSKLTVTLRDMPEVLAELRAEMARMLRRVAADELPAVSRRLHEIADAFQAGQTEEE